MSGALAFHRLWPLGLLFLLPLLWAAACYTRGGLGRARGWALLLLRSLTLASIALALARPQWVSPAGEVAVVYALDVSHSVAPEFVEQARRWIAKTSQAGRPAAARYIAFAGRALSLPRLEALGDSARLDPGATNLERALEQSLASFAPGEIKRLVLLSDGNGNEGDPWRVVPRLKAEGVRVFTVAARVSSEQDAWVEGLEAASPPRRDEPVVVSVAVMAQQSASAQVRLLADGREVGARALRLLPGRNRLDFLVRFRSEGLVRLRAEVKALGDRIPENDALEEGRWVEPRSRVLLLEQLDQASGPLRRALRQEGIDTDVSTPGPTVSLESYGAVMLNDLPAGALDMGLMQRLERYVRDDGGGVVFSSGPNTHGAQGYAGTPVERLLPVEFKAPEERRDLALVVCLDRSYSMKGRSMELAKAAAVGALELLEPQHWFGLVAFDSRPHEVVPLETVGDRRRALDLIGHLQASGQTNIYPALEMAYRMLAESRARSRHVILLSDGDSAPADFARLLQRMTGAHITVSTVAIGKAADRELMARVAQWGRGRSYFAKDAGEVPQIFVEDTQSAARTTLVEEPTRALPRRRVEAFRGLDFSAAPPLAGYASARARPQAEVLLASEPGSALLARWQYGLGRAVFFAGDTGARWSAPWLAWDGFGRFWSQLLRGTLRRDARDGVRLEVSPVAAAMEVSLAVTDAQGRWVDGARPQVRITDARGATREVVMQQTGPGHYGHQELASRAARSPYHVELLDGGGLPPGTARRAGQRAFYQPLPDELRSRPPDVALLQALSASTGGRFAPGAAEIFDRGSDRGEERHELSRALLAAALLCYLLDLALRRVPWPPLRRARS